MGLKNSSEPLLILHELYALAAGGSTAVATADLSSLPVSVRIAAPFVVSSLVKLAAWLDRRYVSPAYTKLQSVALEAGVTLPSEDVIKADVVKVIDASPSV